MPNNLWKKIQKLLNPTTLDLLETELKKTPEQQSLCEITALIKTLLLKKESIPIDLLETYSILIQILNNITLESSFNKKIIYYSSEYEYEEADKHLGEVHALVQYNFSHFENKKPIYLCILHYTAVGFSPYNPYMDETNKNKHYAVVRVHTRIVQVKSNTFSPNFLEHSLIRERFILTNIGLIAHAKKELEVYYYNLASNASRKSNELLTEAFKACLHLPSSENENDLYTKLKASVTQTYLFQGNEAPIPPIVFSHLKTSSIHPEEIYTTLQTERKNQNNSTCNTKASA